MVLPTNMQHMLWVGSKIYPSHWREMKSFSHLLPPNQSKQTHSKIWIKMSSEMLNTMVSENQPKDMLPLTIVNIVVLWTICRQIQNEYEIKIVLSARSNSIYPNVLNELESRIVPNFPYSAIPNSHFTHSKHVGSGLWARFFAMYLERARSS